METNPVIQRLADDGLLIIVEDDAVDGMYEHVFVPPTPDDQQTLDRYLVLCNRQRLMGLTYDETDELHQLTIDLETVGLVQRIR